MSLSSAFAPIMDNPAILGSAWGRTTTVFDVRSSFVSQTQEITIEKILRCRLLRYPYFAFRLNGRRVPVEEVAESRRVLPGSESTGYLDARKAAFLLASGATGVFYRVDHWMEPLSEVTAYVSQAVRAYCGATVFFTPPESKGLPWHRDPLHVISVQVNGSKKWLIERNPPPGSWAAGDIEGDFSGADREIIEVTLTPGQAVYMPPGVAHTVYTTGEPSTHLSLIIREPDTTALCRAVFRSAIENVRDKLDSAPMDQRLERAQSIVADLCEQISRTDVQKILSTVEDQSMAYSGLQFVEPLGK